MSENWYYVLKGNRQGPVDQDFILSLIKNQELKDEDFVWKKGFDNWKKVREVNELQVESTPEIKLPEIIYTEKKLKDFVPDERVLWIRVGNDRGQAPSDYGPFTMKQLKQLFSENRINGKSLLFSQGMKEWKILADFVDYQEVFEEVPPMIKEEDRRTSVRKPFIARLFIQNNKKLFEGVCRDISIGGMQVLLDDFSGKAGDKITINVHPENSDYHFTASGVVVRLLEGNAGFSFRFQGLNDEAKKAIDKYLQDN